MSNLIILVLSLIVACVLPIKGIRLHNMAVPAGRPEGRITYGKDASEGQFPYQVYIHIQKQNLKFPRCSGSIIHNEWVLTAANCFQDAIEFILVMGITVLRNVNVVKYVMDLNSVIIHKDFNTATHEHNIAVIKIPFTNYTERIQPAKLPKKVQTNCGFDKGRVIASGWGYTDLNFSAFKDTLQWTLLQTIPNTKCQSNVNIKIFRSHICTAPIGNGNICFGDAGGPLVLKSNKIQIGILSMISAVTKPPAIGIYTRVGAYLDWIEKTTGVPLK